MTSVFARLPITMAGGSDAGFSFDCLTILSFPFDCSTAVLAPFCHAPTHATLSHTHTHNHSAIYGTRSTRRACWRCADSERILESMVIAESDRLQRGSIGHFSSGWNMLL